MTNNGKLDKWLLKMIICFQLVSCSNSLVDLYDTHNYKGFLGSFDLEKQYCITLPTLLRNRASSIHTDLCIMLYTGNGCSGYSYKLTSSNYNLHYSARHVGGPIMDNGVYSIGRCKSTLNTAGTDVQFYKGDELTLDIKNLCKRVNIAERLSDATSIVTNENCIILHQKDKNVKLLAGKSRYSENIQLLVRRGGIFDPIIGISPCSTSIACKIIPVLSASAIKFTVTDSVKKSFSKTADLSMAATTTFINDGWATVSQEYKATKTVTEATEITRIKSFSKMTNWKVGTKTELDIETGSWLFAAKSNIRTSFTFDYTEEKTETTEESNTRRHEVSTEFSVNEKIEIEPCTKYKVDSYVRVKEKYPLLYTVTFEVTGKMGDKTMTTKEIRGMLGKLNYIRDKNWYTVVASEMSTIYVDFGVETVISGEGEIIVECRDKQLKTRPVVSYVNMSLNEFNISVPSSVQRVS